MIVISFIVAVSSTQNAPPLVTTKYGNLEGFWKTSYEGRTYAAFEGIPYAKSPVGILRFKVSFFEQNPTKLISSYSVINR